MKNKAFLIVLLGLFTAACSKKEDAPPPYTPHVAGSWTGNGTDDAIGYYNISADLAQSNSSASGDFTMSGPVATIKGTISIVLGPQGGNNLQQLTMTRVTWTVNDPANTNRVCAATMTVQPGSTYFLSGSTVFSYSVTDCQGGTWSGGANLHKIAGTN
jgi:hypothetical protein